MGIPARLSPIRTIPFFCSGAMYSARISAVLNQLPVNVPLNALT